MSSRIVEFRGAMRRLGVVSAISIAVVLTGCAVGKPRVDMYNGLLPDGVTPAATTLAPRTGQFRNQTVYIVLGANYLSYSETWAGFQKIADEGGFANLAYTREELQAFQRFWSPERTTSLVVDTLKKHFADVRVADDLAQAKELGARWIVVYDHSYRQPTTATATWTNHTVIDLLSADRLQLIARAEVSETQSRGIAMGSSDVHRLTRQRGEDLVGCITRAAQQFDRKLSALDG